MPFYRHYSESSDDVSGDSEPDDDGVPSLIEPKDSSPTDMTFSETAHPISRELCANQRI